MSKPSYLVTITDVRGEQHSFVCRSYNFDPGVSSFTLENDSQLFFYGRNIIKAEVMETT